MPSPWPPQPDVFREAAPHRPWNSDHEWTIARVHARWHQRREPDDLDLVFAQAVLTELGRDECSVS